MVVPALVKKKMLRVAPVIKLEIIPELGRVASARLLEPLLVFFFLPN
jgi:hypothetical protein